MKSLLHICAIACATTPFAANAGNLEPAPAAQQVFVETDTNWAGSYVGLAYSHFGGDIEASGSSADLESDSQPQVFGGYLFQKGNLVYGAELSYGPGAATSVAGTSDPNEIGKILDLKGRLGFGANRFLVYGLLGYSRGELDPNTGTPADEVTFDGVSYGIGVDYAVSKNFRIGAEYLSRNLDGTIGSTNYDTDLNSLSLRASYRF